MRFYSKSEPRAQNIVSRKRLHMNRRFTAHMDEIVARQLELQRQVRRENTEMRDMKASATMGSVHVTTGRSISNAKLIEHLRQDIRCANTD